MAQHTNFGYTAGDREKAFTVLYKKAFPGVARYVSRMGGDFDAAKDVFQDALVIYYEKSVTGAIGQVSGEQAYLLGIAKHLWLRRFNKSIQCAHLDQEDLDIAEEETHEPSEDRLMHFLASAGKKCMEMLKAFYYDSLSVKEIAEQFGFSGERSATVQKYKCMEKVRETIKEGSLAYEDFVE